MNQYRARNSEVDQLVDGRLVSSQARQQWRYNEQAREIMSSKNKSKYQDVDMSYKVQFLDDMKSLIFDPKRFPEDLNIFMSNDWTLNVFEQKQIPQVEHVPPSTLLKKNPIKDSSFDDFYGPIQMQGRINIKFSQVNYTPIFYNLRGRAIFFYQLPDLEKTDKESFKIFFSENVYNYLSQNDEFFPLKLQDKLLKIKKENQSRDLIRAVERKLLTAFFRGAFVLRNEVPHFYVQDYINRQIEDIKQIDFVHENHLKDIVASKYYREAIGGFFHFLNRQASKRKANSGEITYPRWLKQELKTIPNFEVNLNTNVVPNKVPLMNLKIKINQSQFQAFAQSLKYIFPFYKNYLKRTLIVYESNLQDDHVKYMMSQISYPMHTIGVPKNQLSIEGLEHIINASGTLYHEAVDFSYNAKLMSISGGRIFTLTNANPSVKQLIIKGCYVLMGEEDDFFLGLTNNMCLRGLEIDYMDSYNEAMIKYLVNYDAQIY